LKITLCFQAIEFGSLYMGYALGYKWQTVRFSEARASRATRSVQKRVYGLPRAFLLAARAPTLNVLRLVRASATVPGGSSDVVRARVTETAIARQNHASAVAVFERAILAVPIHSTRAQRDHCAIGSLRFCWLQSDEHNGKGGGGN